MKQAARILLVLSLFTLPVLGQSAPAQQPPARQVAVEVFQILELPITITNPALVKTKTGYQLTCQLSNGSEFQQLGIRYSLAVIDSTNATSIVTRDEGFKLPAYQMKSVSFKTPIKLKLKDGERIVLMVEQVISTDYVWDVLKARDSLAAYISGDYSVTPRVVRVSNYVDAPIREGNIY
jgi:hypothetical protein